MKKFLSAFFVAMVWFILFQINFNSNKTFEFPPMAEASNVAEESKETKTAIATEKVTVEEKKADITKEKQEQVIYMLSEKLKEYINKIPLSNIQSRENIVKKIQQMETERAEYENLAKKYNLQKSDEYIDLYNAIRNREEAYKKELEYLKEAEQLWLISQDIGTPNKTVKQKFKANTCVIDSLGFIMEHQYKKKLNKDLVYKALGKNIGDYWNSGTLYYNGTFFWNTSKDNDYYKLAAEGIIVSQLSNIKELRRELVDNKTIVIFEALLSEFDSSHKGKIYHAVSVTKIENNVITFADSLTGTMRTMNIEKWLDEVGTFSTEVSFRTVTFDNSKAKELMKFFY